MRNAIIGLVCVSVVGCSQGSTDFERVGAEANTIGITAIEIQHLSRDGEQLLVVRGLDATGAEVARAKLRTGRVQFGYDESDTKATYDGTELELTTGGQKFSDITPDRRPHDLYTSLAPAIANFVGLRAVAAALDDEAGIKIKLPAVVTETAEGYGPCADFMFPTNRGGSDQCCLNWFTGTDSVQTVHKIGGTQVGLRTALHYGYQCMDSGGLTGCTTNCDYGPCGFRPDGALSGADVVVFLPHDNYGNGTGPGTCGYDTDADSSSGYFSPEQWDGTQPIAAPVGATCDCTGCNSDGTPTPAGCHAWF